MNKRSFTHFLTLFFKFMLSTSALKKKFSFDTIIGQKRKKNDERKLCQILHCGNDTAIVKWTESISSKQMARGGGIVWGCAF